jgi:hypothetical protein
MSTSSSGIPFGRHVLTVHRPPRVKKHSQPDDTVPALASVAIANDQKFVVLEQRRYIRTYSLKLVEGAFNGSVFIGWVFEFQNSQWQAINEDYNVRRRVRCPSTIVN